MCPPNARTGHAPLLWDPTRASLQAVLTAAAAAHSSLPSTNVSIGRAFLSLSSEASRCPGQQHALSDLLSRGWEERKGEESMYFVASILMGFCFLSKFHMSVYSCLRSWTWMPGFDLRTNCPINSWMSEFNLHLSPLTFTLAFPFIIGDILTAKYNKIRATESELDCEHRLRQGGMMCDAGQCWGENSF